MDLALPMNGVGWLILYTPLPWLAAMYLAAYRHDVFRFAKPFGDHDDLCAWWSVCRHLGLIELGAPRPARRVWRSRPLLALVAITSVSLIGPPVLAQLGWYYLVLFQIVAALGLFLVLVNRIGPVPSRPYTDMLPYPRLGTRARHLMRGKATRPDPTISITKGGDATR